MGTIESGPGIVQNELDEIFKETEIRTETEDPIRHTCDGGLCRRKDFVLVVT